MADDELRGAVHWIDHFVVGTNDLVAWADWAVNATGVAPSPIRGVTTAARKRNQPFQCFLWWDDPSCRMGAFLQSEMYPSSKELGHDTPLCGFYVRPEDMDRHVQRLDRHAIPHTSPARIETEGDPGTTVFFADPDGNQWAFFAPDEMPAGAMEVSTSNGVGRISHAVYGSRDLQRTAGFYEEYCGVRPVQSTAIPEDTLVLRLQGGARIVYNLVDVPDERTAGHGPWWDMHTALTVRDDEFFPNYQRMWAGLPEEPGPKEDINLPLAEEDALPARTGLHRSPVGYRWKETYSRGDEFYDWDGHAFHFIGGVSQTDDGSLARYVGKEQDAYLNELTDRVKTK
jgi:catechol 2,3-dioxygenase-like lactoylglutathione lyase family enzyme